MSDILDIQFNDEEGRSGGNGRLDKVPNECPQCHEKISPIKWGGFFNRKNEDSDKTLEVVFRCPNNDCHEIFIGYYSKRSDRNDFYLRNTEPKTYSERLFSNTIKGLSVDFPRIFNQSLAAENAGLDQVCGAGYRKALEFLAKDYLLKQVKEDEEQEKIKSEPLATCIKNRIKDPSIKEVAKRAAWLGNDETHYLRKWDQKDLQDLKKLIDLTVHWMEAEALTAQLLQDMPNKE
ncbi:MAG: DUF4145 domain-containing protein [Candidatus Nealsonbacteria bacterium]|nr:DUF4145 domain-containing protein [Candidatus Nealsonbacteria bacterium]